MMEKMEKLKISNSQFKPGYTSITTMDKPKWDDPQSTKMDFGILLLKANETYKINENLEKACMLLNGQVKFRWGKKGESMQEATGERKSLFSESPCCLHVPKSVQVELIAGSDGAEINIIKTKNETEFPAKFYTTAECRSENRGAGTMRETSTRIVRTIFDISNAPNAKLVLGEVVTYPGKWSSYPPHHHAQPEIYHYRFLPEQGFGFCMMGEDVVKVKQNDTTLILNDASHPQTAAPGYAMYYIWAIRHLDNNPYIKPTFEPEHTWVQAPENQKKIFPPEK